jgi:hypothetical protein
MNFLFLTNMFLGTATAEELTFQTGQAFAVHLPTGGLDQIGVALQNVLPSSITVAAGSNDLECSSTTSVTYTIDEMDLIFAIDDVEFVTQNGFLDLLVTGHIGSSETTATIMGDCSVLTDLNEVCSVQLGTTPFTLSMSMRIELTETELVVEAENPIFEVAPITNPLEDCVLADGLDTVLGQDPYVFSNLLQEAVEPELDVVPQTIEDNLSDVLETLVVSEQVDLLGKELSVLLEPSDVRVDESGIVMGFGANISVPTPGQCVDTAQWLPPEDNDWPVFSGEMFVTGLRYDIGVFVGQHFMNQVLYAVWASEALCLDVSSFIGLEFTGDFAAGFFGADLGTLMGDKTVAMTLESRNPLNVEFSDDQPPIRISADGLALQTRGEVLDRDVLLQSVEMGAELGVFLELDTGRLTADIPIDSQDFFYAEEYFEILPEGYSAGVPNLIDLALGSVITEDMFPTLILPKILGMELSDIIWQPSADGAWLGGHIILDVDEIQSSEIAGCSGDSLGCNGGGPTIDIDIDNILGCDDATVGCEGGCSQAQDGTITLRLPAGRVFGVLLLVSVVLIRRRESE